MLGKQRFSNESNMVYKVDSVESILNDTEKLVDIINHHKKEQRTRLETLREYFKGNNESILTQPHGRRRREEKLADNRATHNFAEYVSGFIQGYMMGVPLKTSYPDELVDEQLRELNRINDADEHNSEIVLDQSIYGRAYEMVYRNQNDETRFLQLDVLETFIIYDDSIEQNPLAGVRYIGKQFEDDERIYVYTDDTKYTYSLNSSDELELNEEEPHYFNAIPIIEYTNNKYRQGDFEKVLGLIDLYDNAQSDTANYMEDLNDAMLLIKGNLELDVEQAEIMKNKNIMLLQTEPTLDGKESSVDAEYIYKKYDVAGTEAYKDRIFNNILLFTSIPNLLEDQANSQVQSGEAIKMKMFALAQKRATKERLFKKSLRDRYRVINNLSKVASEGEFDVNEISITFTENLPSMIAQDIEWFSKMGGQLSNGTMLENLPFIENADEEAEKIEEEDELNKPVYQFAPEDNQKPVPRTDDE